MELSGTDDDLSVRESAVGSMDSAVERELLTWETDTTNLVVAKDSKKGQTQLQKARKGYENSRTFIWKISLKREEDLSDSDKALMKLNQKIISSTVKG